MADGPSAQEFVSKWAGRKLTERQSAQAHFIDLCRVLGVPAPHDDASTDQEYCFEARTGLAPDADAADDAASAYTGEVVSAPNEGFADVWKRRHFVWEYKRPGKHKDLAAALKQLKDYKDQLDNPPLLVACDIETYDIRTNFTGYPERRWRFRHNDIANPTDEQREKGWSPLSVLRRLFTDPGSFKPDKDAERITQDVAKDVGGVAQRLRDRNKAVDPQDVAHFVMQVVFCCFAEDIGLLRRELFTELLRHSHQDPENFPDRVRRLFREMESGGLYGSDTIEHFNGGLFKRIEDQPHIDIHHGDLGKLLLVARHDWSEIEPSILGTLFERSLDPKARAQIGAHYTSRADILLIVEPVVMAPLRRQWRDVRAQIADLPTKKDGGLTAKAAQKAENMLADFHERLSSVRILDPACGSGNFLYVAIQQLLDLERQVIAWSGRPEIGLRLDRRVSPRQLLGIDINPYAAELARVAIWIGYLKWLHDQGESIDQRPILDDLNTIEQRDAILDLSDPDEPRPAQWPEADFIIGNPPFLGTKLLRRHLGDEYVETLYGVYRDAIPPFSDLCCYWFEQARRCVAEKEDTRAGLLATQAIRNTAARRVLERIGESQNIFYAWSDRKWILEGAAVHVAIVGFTGIPESSHVLDGHEVATINTDLSAGVNLGLATRLDEQRDVGFIGTQKSGPFEVSWQQAHSLLATPNAIPRSNFDVLYWWVNGQDVTGRHRGRWVIAFPPDATVEEAARYEAPFLHCREVVAPRRRADHFAEYPVWLHWRPRPEMRQALAQVERFCCTARVAKHHILVWLPNRTVPDSAAVAFARSDDYFFGVLHSAVHELWALRMGTQLESRPRYTPTTCFETFPLPWPPGQEPAKGARHRPLHDAIAEAAHDLDEQRERWLNPPEWIEAVARQVDLNEDFSGVPEEARPLLRQSAIMAYATKHKELKTRTLTNLYNKRPTWLRLAHRRLDEAVLAAYAAVDPAGGWDAAWAEAYEPYGAGHITVDAKKDKAEAKRAKEDAIAARAEVDEKILAAVLRLNLERAAGE